MAKGARRQNSSLLAGTQFLCFGEYILFKGQEHYSINSCDTIEMFYNIRTDLDKFKYAVHITKIIQDVTNENENSYKVLQLFLNTLYIICEGERDKDFVLNIFKMKLLCILGFKPRIEECTNCKRKNELTHFSIKDNGIKCSSCSTQDKGSIKISTSTLTALKFITSVSTKNVFNFNLKGESLKEFNLLVKIFFNEKLEKEYKLEELW